MITHHFIAEPIRSYSGKLLGVEMLTRFTLNGKLLKMTEEIIYHLETQVRNQIFKEQIALILHKSDFFIKNEIICSINVDMDAISFILSDDTLKSDILSMPFLKLELYEKIHFLHEGINNPTLRALAELGQELWMDDFGSSEADLQSLEEMPYTVAKVDRLYYLNHISDPRLPTTIKNIKSFCSKIIIEGIEDKAHLEELRPFDIWGIQGYIYPSIEFINIKELHL